MHIAYLAGLLDGEGSIMLTKQGPRRCRRPQLSIGMTNRNVIEAVKASYGGFIQVRPATPARQAMFTWNLKGTPALDLLAEIRPRLVIERRKTLADILLNANLLRDSRARNKQAVTEQLFKEMQTRNTERKQSVPSIKAGRPTPGDFAYLAGILDGEGHIGTRLVIEVTSTDPELPAWLQSRFGGNTYLAKKEHEARRSVWRWIRPPTGFDWATGVAAHMMIERKKRRVELMEDFRRLPAVGQSAYPHNADADYIKLRKSGVLARPAARESGLPYPRALFLERS